MAIDSALKRANVPSVGRPWKRPRIIADGSFSQGDRQQIGNGWASILAEAPVVPVVIARISFALQQRAIEFALQVRSIGLWLS